MLYHKRKQGNKRRGRHSSIDIEDDNSIDMEYDKINMRSCHSLSALLMERWPRKSRSRS